jgi:hypothetical protein
MSLLSQRSQLELDLASKDEAVLKVASVIHSLVSVLKETNKSFWSLPTDRLLAVLNHDVPTTQTTFDVNTSLGIMLNGLLDQLALPQFQNRAPVTAGRQDIVFNGSTYEYVAPPEPEPEPELDPNP